MAGFFEKTIGPVAIETSAKNVRRAFELGCSAVIIDGVLPEIVAAEIEAALKSDPSNNGEKHKGLCLEFAGGGTEDVSWQEGFLTGLQETGRWVAEQAQQTVAEGLRPVPAAKAGDVLMTLWQNLALFRGWHIDDAGPVAFPDVHFHIYGAGMQIADPQGPQSVRIDKNEKSLVLQFQPVADENGMLIVRDQFSADFDDELVDRGFQLLTLQPGQRLVFSNDCLHRSAIDDPQEMRLRAAMF